MPLYQCCHVRFGIPLVHFSAFTTWLAAPASVPGSRVSHEVTASHLWVWVPLTYLFLQYWAEPGHNNSSWSTQYAVHVGDTESTIVDLIELIPFPEDPGVNHTSWVQSSVGTQGCGLDDDIHTIQLIHTYSIGKHMVWGPISPVPSFEHLSISTPRQSQLGN